MDKEIVLVVFLLFSAGSQVLDGVKDAQKRFREVDRWPLRRKKSLRSTGSENQSIPGPPSSRDSASCSKGRYRYDRDNCLECKSCTEPNTVAVGGCEGIHNTECGCAEGYFNALAFDAPGLFSCQRCTNCSALHKETREGCSPDSDAKCGSCSPRPCATVIEGSTSTTAADKVGIANPPSSSNRPQKPQWPLSTTMVLAVPPLLSPKSTPLNKTAIEGISQNEQCNGVCKIAIGACGCIFILAGVLVLYLKKKKITSVQKPIPAPNIYNSSLYFGNPVSALPESASLMDKAPPPSRSLQQGRHLYTIINAVPVRRWKEFVRGLGLRDGEIELVELEQSQFREQQYEMLKRWCQQRGASLEAILDTLEAMQLGGCAQELRENLQVEHLRRSP